MHVCVRTGVYGSYHKGVKNQKNWSYQFLDFSSTHCDRNSGIMTNYNAGIDYSCSQISLLTKKGLLGHWCQFVCWLYKLNNYCDKCSFTLYTSTIHSKETTLMFPDPFLCMLVRYHRKASIYMYQLQIATSTRKLAWSKLQSQQQDCNASYIMANFQCVYHVTVT